MTELRIYGTKYGDGYDWDAIAADLSQIMNLADEKVKEGDLLDVAEIAPMCRMRLGGYWK